MILNLRQNYTISGCLTGKDQTAVLVAAVVGLLLQSLYNDLNNVERDSSKSSSFSGTDADNVIIVTIYEGS